MVSRRIVAKSSIIHGKIGRYFDTLHWCYFIEIRVHRQLPRHCHRAAAPPISATALHAPISAVAMHPSASYLVPPAVVSCANTSRTTSCCQLCKIHNDPLSASLRAPPAVSAVQTYRAPPTALEYANSFGYCCYDCGDAISI